jgi:hypothetical protein
MLERLAELLALAPEPTLSRERIGVKRPAALADLPALALSVLDEGRRGIGLGRFVREGHTLAQSTTAVTVAPGADGFSADLRTYALSPLPLRRDPASLSPAFGPDDVRVSSAGGPGAPVSYRLVANPTAPDEFALDVAHAQLVFGAAQRPGDVLQIVHWTVTWRDEIRIERAEGTLALEAWATTFALVDGITARVQEHLGRRAAARERGFLRLAPAALESAAEIRQDGATFAAWVQRLAYRFTFEAQDGGAESTGTRIKRIDVGMNGALTESLVIPSTISAGGS